MSEIESAQMSCLSELAGSQLLSLTDLLASATAFSAKASILPEQISPSALAYVGDAVYELYVRTRYLLPPKRPQDYHNQVVAQVRAESQAHHLQSLQPYLTEVEREMIRRGRNSAARGPKRTDPGIYQQATGLETLLGYLYMRDPQRLVQLLDYLQLTVTEPSPLS